MGKKCNTKDKLKILCGDLYIPLLFYYWGPCFKGIKWQTLKSTTMGIQGYNSLSQLIVEVSRLGTEDTEHSFEYGRPVCFFRMLADGIL